MGTWVKMPRFNTFSRNASTINLKFFPNHGEIYRFERKFKKHSGERVKEFIEIWKDVSLRLIFRDKGGNRHCFYHFVDPELGVKISLKKRATEKEGVEIEDWGISAHTCHEVSRKFHAEPVCFYMVFMVTKKNSL